MTVTLEERVARSRCFFSRRFDQGTATEFLDVVTRLLVLESNKVSITIEEKKILVETRQAEYLFFEQAADEQIAFEPERIKVDEDSTPEERRKPLEVILEAFWQSGYVDEVQIKAISAVAEAKKGGAARAFAQALGVTDAAELKLCNSVSSVDWREFSACVRLSRELGLPLVADMVVYQVFYRHKDVHFTEVIADSGANLQATLAEFVESHHNDTVEGIYKAQHNNGELDSFVVICTTYDGAHNAARDFGDYERHGETLSRTPRQARAHGPLFWSRINGFAG